VESPAAPEQSALSAAPAAPPPSQLRGDARIVGFVATPFGGNTGGAAIGFGVQGNVGWGRIPITIGVDVMTAYFGTETSQVLVQAGDTWVTADRNREDLSYFLDASVRLQPIDWRVRPYAEGFVGTKLLETHYSLSFPDSGTSTDTVSDHAWAGSIGWGVGIDFSNVMSQSLGFTLGVRRLSGSEASFSRSADVNGNVIVRYTAPTSCMLYMLGLMGTFGATSATPRP
jgi:hypothetical protein